MINKFKFLICILGTIVSITVSIIAHCKANAVQPRYIIVHPKAALPGTPNYYGWSIGSWSGDDSNYRSARAIIDNEILFGANPKKLIAKYILASTSKPKDPLAQFRYGYAVYKMWDKSRLDYLNMSKPEANEESSVIGTQMMTAGTALRVAPFPHTYNYHRLEFLIAVNSNHAESELLPLAERLRHRSPHDDDVEYGTLIILRVGMKTSDTQEAFAIVNDLIRRHPKSLRAQSALVQIYGNIWGNSFLQADADKAIAMDQHFMAMLPPNSVERHSMLLDIMDIQRQQAFYEKQRKLGRAFPLLRYP